MKRSVALVDLVSKGSPPRFHAPPGTFFCISPVAKKHPKLDERHSGVRKLYSNADPFSEDELLKDQKVAAYLARHVESGLKDAVDRAVAQLQAQFQGQLLNANDRRFVDQVYHARIVRTVVDMWCTERKGRHLMRHLTASVNQGYSEKGSHRFDKLTTEIKDLLRDDSLVSVYLPILQSTIDRECVQLGGRGLVDLLRAYLEANSIIHRDLSRVELQEVQAKIQSGYAFGEGNGWIMKMTEDLLTG